MRRLDGKSLPSDPNEIRLFAVVRNESPRIQSWLRHYRALGVGRFFIVDNDSTDGTGLKLLDEPDVHLFHTAESFDGSNYGRLWIRELMENYGMDRWCVVADGDEFLAPPFWEKTDLRRVAAHLDTEGAEALSCQLLDMYSSRPVRDIAVRAGGDLLTVCPYFDPYFRPHDGTFAEGDLQHPIKTYVGSTREKVFGVKAYLSKIGMLRYRPGIKLTSGQHAVLGARVSEIRGAMFHFKFMADFVLKLEEEMDRDQRSSHAHEWIAYAEAFRSQPDLSLFDERSVRLQGSRQLINLGVMTTTPAYEARVKGSTS